LAAVPVGLATDNGQVPAAAAAQGPGPGRSLREIRRPAAPVPPGPAVAAAPAAPKPKVVPGKRGLERAKVIASVDPAESGKWEAFDELLEEALGSGLKVVVFTQYLGMIDLISHALKQKGVGHTELRGDTPDRGARLEKFANDPECKVFLCSLLAGGLGIDLTAASVCIHMDRWWNPAKENQATDRLHRYGQTRGVQVFKLQIPGTVEDRIASIIQSKMQLADALIEESSLGLKSFSRKELLELLSPAAEDDEPAHADEA
jgi:SNF2 family DNA or RNA helicase